jgi:hypothetical protein
MINNLVFSSVGDDTNFYNLWVNPDAMNYDIYVIYYGDSDVMYDFYKSKVKGCIRRKGSKFQNFLYFFNTYPEIINKYERFFILDDDIIMSAADITAMFVISKHLGTKICQPSFTREGKLSHQATLSLDNAICHYTNYIEVNTPLFTREALFKFMPYMDDTLIGWGIDYLYIYVNGCESNMPLEECSKFYAVIDCIKCINPFQKEKKGETRELYKIKGALTRVEMWEKYAKEHNIPSSFPIKTYDIVHIKK